MPSTKTNYPTIEDINKYWKNDPPEGKERPISFSKNFKCIKLSQDKRYSYTLYISKEEYVETILNKENLLNVRYLKNNIADNGDFGDFGYYKNRSHTNRMNKK